MFVVTVCTANLCRSPFAEQVLQRAFDRAGRDVTVRSTGTDVVAGLRPPQLWIDVTAPFGVHLADHRSVAPEDVLEGADLLLAMTADHARALVVARPELVGRVTTLGSAVDQAEQGAPSPGDLVVARRGVDLLMAGNEFDIPDPVGRSRRVQRAVAEHVVDLCARLVNSWPGGEGP